MAKTPEGMLRVVARNKTIRETIRHPTAGALTDDPAGALWPADQFTFRRLEDGDISEVTEAPVTKTADPAPAAAPSARRAPRRPATRQPAPPPQAESTPVVGDASSEVADAPAPADVGVGT